jgi:hypothetical protein
MRVIYIYDGICSFEACREVAPGFVFSTEIDEETHEVCYERLLQYNSMDELAHYLTEQDIEHWDTAAEPMKKWEDMPESRYTAIESVDKVGKCSCPLQALLQKGCSCGGQ